MLKKSIIGLVILVAVILIAGSSYYFGMRNNLNAEPEILVGGDTDSHGCLGSAGYNWCETKQECLRPFEEFCADSATELVGAINQATGVTLTPAGETEFSWLISQDEKTTQIKIPGALFVGSGMPRADYEKVENYLNTTWQADMINMADGITGGLRGYLVNYMACTLNFFVAELKNNAEGYPVPINDKVGVKLTCGFFNPNNVPQTTVK